MAGEMVGREEVLPLKLEVMAPLPAAEVVRVDMQDLAVPVDHKVALAQVAEGEAAVAEGLVFIPLMKVAGQAEAVALEFSGKALMAAEQQTGTAAAAAPVDQQDQAS